MFPVTQKLRVRGELARRAAGILYVVDQVDGILPACEDKGLGDAESLAVGPGQRDAQLRGDVREYEGILCGSPSRQVGGRGFAGSAGEPGLQQIQGFRRLAAQ